MPPGARPDVPFVVRPLAPSGFSLEEGARRAGHYRWVELRLFEVLGGWVAGVPEVELKPWLSTRSYRHAWHAELWEQRLPELRGMDRDQLTAPASPELEHFVSALASPPQGTEGAGPGRGKPDGGGRGPEGRKPDGDSPEGAGLEGSVATIEKLVGVYRVLLPHLVAAYSYHLELASPLADAPTIRALELVLRDELEDWRDGELVLQWLVGTPEQLERASARRARMEAELLRAGGVAGPGSTWRRTDTGR
jgi:hypothetical protein